MMKIRKSWKIKPTQKAHSSPKGKRGYKRAKINARNWKQYEDE